MASSLVSSLLLLLLLAVIISTFQRSDADISGDQQECTDQLVGLATCLSYVQGGAKAPTPDCCAGLKEVLSKSPKCLCVLIKDHDDPHLGIKINVSLALALPVACDRPVNISKCPKLLKLPPNSPDAQIFTRVPQKAEQGNAPKSGVTAEGNLTSAHQNSGSTSIGHLRRLGKGKRWLRIEMLGGSLLLLLLLLPLVVLM